MKNVIVAWCNKDEQVFEVQIPLLFFGRCNKSLGFKGMVDVVFIAGFNRLGGDCKDKLKALGCVLHDARGLFTEFEKSYKALDLFGDYEKKAFLAGSFLRSYSLVSQLFITMSYSIFLAKNW